MFFKNITHLFCAVALLAVLAPVPSHAYKVMGHVRNGTSGQTNVAADIELVSPRGGMQVEQQLRAENGTFLIENLSDTSHVYVIRTVYQGVSYPGIIRYTGADTSFYEITVYDTTSSIGNIHVSIPHMMIRRMGEHYRFELIYEIVNHTDPPMVLTDKPFKLYMPEDRVSVNALYTTELGLPINRDPIPTDVKGIYRIDSPLKPGPTRLALSFDVHAHDGSYEYMQVLPYDLESFVIMLEDPAIEVTSENIALEKTVNAQGGVEYSASSLAKMSVLSFRVSGGSAASEPSPDMKTRIITQSQATEGGSIPLILIVTLFLLALPVLSARKPAAEKPRANHIELQKNQLLSQIARLDDLYAAGTVAEQPYHAKRTELKNRLAYFMQQTGAPKSNASKKAKRPKKGS